MTGRRAFIAALLLGAPLFAGAQPLSRAEIENARRYVPGGEPRFQVVTQDALKRSISVASARSYAVFGYNNPKVVVGLPKMDNSAYATVEFPDAKPVDVKGKEPPHELEHGIYDHTSHSVDIRFAPGSGKDLVPLVRAVGRVKVKYPLAVETRTVSRSSPGAAAFALDGPYVTFTPEALDLPKGSFTPAVEPIRAYDAAGHRLERYENFQKSELAGEKTRRTIAFWGPVARVRVDAVVRWGEVEIPFDVPAAPKLPAGREGLKP